jgi:hypothetical protein
MRMIVRLTRIDVEKQAFRGGSLGDISRRQIQALLHMLERRLVRDRIQCRIDLS